MAVKISDEQVLAILKANASKNQQTDDPEMPEFRNSDGSLKRERTIGLPCYTLTDEEVAEILA